MVLLFSHQFDYSTNQVINWLKYMNIKYIRINSDENRFKLVLVNSEKILFLDLYSKKEINLLDIDAVWYRRGGISDRMLLSEELWGRYKNSCLDTEIMKNLDEQFIYLKNYIIDRIFNNCSIRLGNPFCRDLNRLKMYDLAKNYGFHVPQFDIVTKTSQLGDVLHKYGSVVSKSIANGVYYNTNIKRYYSYTEEIKENDTIDLKEKHVFPSLLAQKIDKAFEIRSFFLVDNFYSTAILSQKNSQTSVDYRKYSKSLPNRQEPFKLENDTENRLKEIFHKLELNTGSVDLIIDKNEQIFFLEINPVGQFGSVSFACNYKLEQKIAEYLSFGTI